MISKKLLFGVFLICFSLFLGSVFAYTVSTPNYNKYGLGDSTTSVCTDDATDFLIQIAPFGCTPKVVTSDLLEEQDVPVYCKLSAIQLNSLIDVKSIDSISFSGNYSDMISGVGFHPAKAALGISGTSSLENIGYVVILLKQQKNESAMPENLTGTLTATIKYDIDRAFGIGKASFFLPELTDSEWKQLNYKSSFWGGKGYLKADSVDNNEATISVYSSSNRISTVALKKGETSNNIYLPGFECQAGLKLTLTDVESPNTMARLRVNSEYLELVTGEKFLDNKCTVKAVSKKGLVQQVKVTCIEDEETTSTTLTISPRVILNIDGEKNTYHVGDWLWDTSNKSIYLGYIGSSADSPKTDDLFVYLFSSPEKKDKLSDSEISYLSTLVGDLMNTNSTSTGVVSQASDFIKSYSAAANRISRSVANGQDLLRINHGTEYFGSDKSDFSDKSVYVIGYADGEDIDLTGDARENYLNAVEDYQSLIEQYPSETYSEDSTYGEEAFYQYITIAFEADQKLTAQKLCKEFEERYPDTQKDMTICDSSYKLSSEEESIIYVTVDGKIKKIIFDGVYEPTFEDYGVKVMVKTPNETKYFDLPKNKIVYFDKEGSDYLQLVSADDSSSKIKTSLGSVGLTSEIQKQFNSDVIKLNLDTPINFEGGYSFTLMKINLKKYAKVSVNPNIQDTSTQANFTFSVGIEKRAIQLSPDKIKEIIEQLDKEIKQWDGISESLGDVVEGLKTSCLATGVILVAKNFLVNTGSTGTARTIVMRGTNGWYEKCSDLVSKGTYTSRQQCYNENANQIDADVKKLSGIIEEQNSVIKGLEEGITTSGLFFDKTVNTSAFIEGYAPQVSETVKQNLPEEITDPSGKSDSIDKSQILSILTYNNWNKDEFTLEQLRDIELYSQVLGDSESSDELKDIANSELYSTFADIVVSSESSQKASTWADSLGVDSSKISSLESSGNIKKIEYQGLVNKDLGSRKINEFSDNAPVALIQTFPDGKEYILILDDSSGTSKLPILRVDDHLAIYSSSGTLVEKPTSDLTNIYFERYDSSTYENEYKNAELRYYETEPYKGMPAVVPFDLKNGWYAATKQTLGTSEATTSYDASGRVNSFYLCNVGENGLEEFQTVGDDICEMINTGTGQAYDQFPGLSETDAKKHISCGVSAIEKASEMYESGLSGTVKITTSCGTANVKVGSPAVDTPEFECQDFMSPNECLLLFNLCDPVICPSSRCDLGGTYPVQNVIQSGIIGSIVLCLPNIQEGIIVPVCLTGIKAGIDSFVSVKQAYRDCLQESLDTGAMVGICDEIYSIYLCEFFWEQAAPLAELAIPKIIEVFMGQNVRGGGEYLSVASAWSSAENAIDYFVNSYGVNSRDAFLSRNSSDVGSQFCKAYVSTVSTSGGDLLSSLTQADSPAQYTGRFDETVMTTVTSPSTSHYKVYYHIYAGKDTGAYYKVYLKGSSTSSYYKDNIQSITVASGYIPLGEYASETKDFTANSGYTTLCIDVNGQEECGFGEISTSFAIDYITDEIVSSEASQTDITTEENCISGYTEGIIRVCATDDPGKGSDPYAGTANARWQKVGYCDNEKIYCWIDTDSLENAITSSSIQGDTLEEITSNYLEQLINESGYLTDEQYSSVLEEIEEMDYPEQITSTTNVLSKLFWSYQKAKMIYLRGNAYAELFRLALSEIDKPAEKDIGEEIVVVENPENNQNAGNENKETEENNKENTETSIDNEAGNAIWQVAKDLVDDRWNEYRISDLTTGEKDYSYVCVRFVLRVLVNAGIQTKDILDLVGTTKNGKTIFNDESWTDLENMNNLIPIFENSGDYIEVDSDELQKGDIVLFGYNSKNTQHISIFDSYTSDGKYLYVFGDPGQSDKEGRETPAKLQKIIIKSDTWFFYRAFRYVGKISESTDSTTATENSEEPSTSSNIEGDIYTSAKELVGSSIDSVTFVSNTLTGAEVSGMSATSFGSLVYKIENNDKFVEVSLDNLKQGDIILFGRGCTKYMGVFSSKNSFGYVSFYTSTSGYVHLEEEREFTDDGILDDKYVFYWYRAYRYSADGSEKGDSVRDRWTLTSALEKVKTLSGDYSDNKEFCDQLIFDELLTGDDCGDLRGTSGFLGGFFNAEKDMNWLKELLSEKAGVSDEMKESSSTLAENVDQVEGVCVSLCKTKNAEDYCITERILKFEDYNLLGSCYAYSQAGNYGISNCNGLCSSSTSIDIGRY